MWTSNVLLINWSSSLVLLIIFTIMTLLWSSYCIVDGFIEGNFQWVFDTCLKGTSRLLTLGYKSSSCQTCPNIVLITKHIWDIMNLTHILLGRIADIGWRGKHGVLSCKTLYNQKFVSSFHSSSARFNEPLIAITKELAASRRIIKCSPGSGRVSSEDISRFNI